MVHLSDKKFIPWSKHTNYASIVGERRRPSEVGQGTLVNIKNVDKDLDDHRNHLSKMHQKSLFRLDAQRKELEKSMLQYTDKVREIRDTQTNDLFREIHTRQSRRHHRLSDARSLTNSLDSQETPLLPVDSANIRKRKKRLQVSRKSMFPPILESSTKHENRQRLTRPLSADRHCSESKYCYVSKLELRGNDSSRSEQIETQYDRIRDSSTYLNIRKRNPAITIEADCSTPVFESETTDIVESGYSSGVDLKEEPEREEEENDKLTTNNKTQRQELLTLPKIHKRKGSGT